MYYREKNNQFVTDGIFGNDAKNGWWKFVK